MLRRILVPFVFLIGVSGTPAHASRIVVSAEPNAVVCSLTMTEGLPVTVYALAVLGGDAAAAGTVGAGFRILGFEPTWAVVSVPNPAQIVDMGNPVGSGCMLVFSNCLAPTNQIVLLYTMTILPFTIVPHRIVQVIENAVPTEPSFNCPWLLLCNQPNETRICVEGGVSCINSTPACCDIDPVETTSWSQVKSLFAR